MLAPPYPSLPSIDVDDIIVRSTPISGLFTPLSNLPPFQPEYSYS